MDTNICGWACGHSYWGGQDKRTQSSRSVGQHNEDLSQDFKKSKEVGWGHSGGRVCAPPPKALGSVPTIPFQESSPWKALSIFPALVPPLREAVVSFWGFPLLQTTLLWFQLLWNPPPPFLCWNPRAKVWNWGYGALGGDEIMKVREGLINGMCLLGKKTPRN